MAAGNSINDEIKEQRDKVLAELGPWGRFKYFFHYYKWATLAVIIVVCVTVYTIYEFATRKDTVFQVAYVNAFMNVEAADFMAGFEEVLELDTKKEQALLDDSFYIDIDEMNAYHSQNQQRMVVLNSASAIDVCVADEAYFETQASEGAFADLSQILSEEQLAKYEDYFYFYDSEFDDVEGAVPVGIDITNAPKILETESYPNATVYIGIYFTTEHLEYSLAFLDYLHTAN